MGDSSLWIKEENSDWVEFISIPFSREEWELINDELRQLFYIPGFPQSEVDTTLVNIMDRIEKWLGEE